MRYFLICFLFFLTINADAQSNQKRLSQDSVRYYAKEINNMRKAAYDSIQNSARYREIMNRLSPRKSKTVTIELLANVGTYFNRFSGLNARLTSIGQEPIKRMTPSAGVSLAAGYPRIVYGFEMAAYIFDNKSASFKGFHGRLFVGTNIFKRSKIVLNPQIGYATSHLNMFINKSQGQSNFNDLFSTQANYVQLFHSADYLDLAMGFKFNNSREEPFYWQFLRVGYRYGIKEEAWYKRGGDLLNPPKDRNNQFYIQFCLGFDR